MLFTFAALVLGLLTTSVKASFDNVSNHFRGYAIDIIDLGRMLHEYGPEAEPASVLLRRYTAIAIATTWTGEPPPPGVEVPAGLPHPGPDGDLESRPLGVLLDLIERLIRHLEGGDAMHQRLAADCLGQDPRLIQDRWILIEDAHSSIGLPFFIVMTFWLMMVFACFGLSAPRNLLVCTVITLGAMSIASAVYVILDFDTPFTGGLTIPSQPMRDALSYLNR